MFDPANVVVALAAGLLGLLVGSFLNVVAHRLPLGESVWSPSRSYCPSCRTPVLARDNVPVISWLVLHGRCRACGEPIAVRYPLVESATGVLFAAIGAYRGLTPELAPDLVLAATLVVVVATDLEHRIVPNMVLLPAATVAVPLQLLARGDQWPTWSLAAVVAFAFLLLAALVYPAGMGMGDVKLAGVMGLYLGRAVAPALLLAFLLGTLVGLAVMLLRGVAAGRKSALPFAPFLAAGGIAGLFAGDDVVQWYLDTFVDAGG